MNPVRRSGDRAPAVPAFGRRVVAGLLMAAVALGSIPFLPVFTLLLLAVILASLLEFARLAARKDVAIVTPVAALGCAAYVLLGATERLPRFEGAVLALTVIAALVCSLTRRGQGALARSAYTVLAVVYLGKLGSYLMTLRLVPHDGIAYTYLAIVLIAITDIFAMLVGVRFGRTPLSPISPSKTREGALGGFVATIAVGAAAGSVAALHLPWWQGAIVGACTSAGAQVGDLVESAFKRDAAVKDAGSWLGSHGGVLDRFDSYVFGGVACTFALFTTGHVPSAGP